MVWLSAITRPIHGHGAYSTIAAACPVAILSLVNFGPNTAPPWQRSLAVHPQSSSWLPDFASAVRQRPLLLLTDGALLTQPNDRFPPIYMISLERRPSGPSPSLKRQTAEHLPPRERLAKRRRVSHSHRNVRPVRPARRAEELPLLGLVSNDEDS